MIKIDDKKDCCGCNACGDVCPKGAISFASDEEGFLYPHVDATKCVRCGLCVKTCPQIHHEEIKHNEFAQPKITAAINKNFAIRFDSTSGGVFSALAKSIYSQGGYVGGAVWTEDWEIRQIVSDKRNDLPRLRSSKYAQSDARGFYVAVKAAVQTGKPVLVCGTPCQMAALRLFMGKVSGNLFVLDFICRGNNSPQLLKKYIEHHEAESGGKLVSIKFKNKELGWRNLTKKMVFDNGRVVWDGKEGLFSACYHKCHVFCRPSCYDCKFKGVPFVSDITLGDCWVKNGVLKPEMDHDLGTSIVLVNNSKGEKLFESVKKNLQLQDITWQDFLDGNRMFDKSIPMPNYDREELYAILREKGIKAVVDHVEDSSRVAMSLKRRVKNLLRRMLSIKRMSGYSLRAYFRLVRFNGLRKIIRGVPLVFAAPRTQVMNNGGELRLTTDVRIGTGQFKYPPADTYVVIRPKGILEFKGSCHFTYGAAIEVHNGGHLTLGADCGFNVGATIVCANKITIGKGVKGGRNITIRDNNGGHWMNFAGYKDSRPVEIGDHVWLCEGCTIMPGVKIGSGAVVGAKAVVFEDVPANSIVVGNPAKVVNENVEWKY